MVEIELADTDRPDWALKQFRHKDRKRAARRLDF
jgi:hypothetical protein